MAAPPGQGPPGRDEDPARDARGPGDSPPGGSGSGPSRGGGSRAGDSGARDDLAGGWDVGEADGWRRVPCRADWPRNPEEPEAWQGEQPPPDPEHDLGWFPDPQDPALPFDVDLDVLG